MSVKIVVPDDFPLALTGSPAEAQLRAIGDVTVFTERGADQADELVRRVGGAEIVVNIRAHARFTDRVLAACPRLRLISIWGTGTDNVDLAACQARGVAVSNTPGVNAHAVAEHTLALMLAVTRRLPAMDRDVRAGQWPRGRAAIVPPRAPDDASVDAGARSLGRWTWARLLRRVLAHPINCNSRRGGDRARPGYAPLPSVVRAGARCCCTPAQLG